MKLLKKAMEISIKKNLAFPYEVYLVALYSALSITTTLVFWKTLFAGVGFSDYREEFVYILAMVGLFSDGICESFFGLRDLDYLIQTGEFDRYLVRPRHPLYLLLLEKVPIFSVCIKLVLSIAGLVLVCVDYQLVLHPINCIKGFCFLLIGVVYYELIYGLVTVFAFRTENIATFRDLIFQFGNSKQYPLSIFPISFKFVLTHIIPVALLAYYPTVILLDVPVQIPNLFLSFILLLMIVPLTYRWCIAKYTSNGG